MADFDIVDVANASWEWDRVDGNVALLNELEVLTDDGWEPVAYQFEGGAWHVLLRRRKA